MNRFVFGLALLTAACGGKNGATGGTDSLCTGKNPPAACSTDCNPVSGAADCPDGFHCAATGKCDSQCTPTGDECGAGNSCTTDGLCQSGDGGSGDPGPTPIDAACPAIHFSPKRVTPSVQLLIDRSGSMGDPLVKGGASKYNTIRSALTGAQGVITQLQQQVLFGASLFSDDAPCPKLYTVTRASGNKTAIDTLIGSQNPGGNTPTPPAIDDAVAEFTANPPPAGSPPIILLATDGLPNKCGDNKTGTEAESVTAAANSFAHGIKLFVLSVGNTPGTDTHFQNLANAGQGVQPGQPNAAFYPATTPDQLSSAFQTIIGGVISCDLTLNGTVDPTKAASGTVTLGGATLVFNKDWSLDPDNKTLHILGTACTTLKNTGGVVDATFPCGAGVLL